MKGLRKSISILVIASLVCMNGVVASHAEVVSKNINTRQNIRKGQDLKSATNLSSDVKTILGSSVSKAQYLKSQPKDRITNQPSLIAQTSEAESVRNNLRIQPLTGSSSSQAVNVNSPGLTFGTPSAFGGTFGDVFISASAATAGKERSGQVNGSLTAGFGLGDPRKAVALELNYNVGSIKNFGSNGSVDGKLHRIVYAEGTNQVGVAVGWKGFIQHVGGGEGVFPSSVYGAVTSYSVLQPDNEINKMPISFTVGAGGGEFRQGSASTGVFAGVGVQVAPQLSVGAGWSGVGLNAGLSFVPVLSIPLTIGLTGGDLTDNSVGGRVLVLTVGYGSNFLPK